MLNTIDFFLLGGSSGGAGDETAARGDVHEHNGIVLRMDVCLHSLRGCVTVAARRDFTQLSLFVKSYFAHMALSDTILRIFMREPKRNEA